MPHSGRSVARLAILALSFWMWPPHDAVASDGVLEINHACAMNSGCFPGDTAGYPVTIDGSAGRSYVLTSDLSIASASTDAIVITTSLVTLDLGGHAIAGPVECVALPIVCTPGAGLGMGVEVVGSENTGIEVRNGTISGMGGPALVLGDGAIVDGVRVHSNGGYGVYAGYGARISNSVATLNGSGGFQVGGASLVESSRAMLNDATGVWVGSGSVVRRVIANLNNGSGVYAGSGCTITEVTANENTLQGVETSIAAAVSQVIALGNGQDGVRVGGQSSVSGVTAVGNVGDGIDANLGCLVEASATGANGGDGINADRGALIRGSTMYLNGGFGLSSILGTGYGDNVITDNVTGTVNTTPTAPSDIGGNLCNSNSTCP